jgi:tetratricopeptide (TPR) repeat protein
MGIVSKKHLTVIAFFLTNCAITFAQNNIGPGHPDEAASLNNLAVKYYFQGKYSQAEILYNRALEIFEESLGYNHPYVATSLNNMGLLLVSRENMLKLNLYCKEL